MYHIAPETELSPLACAYARARGADRMSSFGDWIALSDICDVPTAKLIQHEVSDGIIAPGYEPEALAILSGKKKGNYNVVAIDPAYKPAPIEHKQVYGITFEQGRNELVINADTMLNNWVTENKDVTEEQKRDLVIALITLKYTQSNSVCYTYHGQTIGVGAGQQSRIHCTRLAGQKADNWQLRHMDKVLDLPFRDDVAKPNRDNAIDVYIGDTPEDVIGDDVWAETFTRQPEPLTVEDVLNVIDKEKPEGVIVQFGGQTAINLAGPLSRAGVKILGSSVDSIDRAEDRERFDELLTSCNIPRPQGHTVFDTEGALVAAHNVGYPTMVRPSYVLGGQGMRIAVSDEDVEEYIGIINQIAQEHPILVDKYLMGKEIEVDAVCDGEDILIPGIMEHIERAGIHSGDSISVYPAQTITPKIKRVLEDYTKKLANSLHVIGLINIQFIVYQDEVYVIEVNPRSSRTVPYISKVTGIPIVDLATRVITGEKIKDMGYTPGLQPESEYFAIKMPVFSFEKIRGAEISLGPEMKSTGECLGISKNYNEALFKAFLGNGVNLPKYKKMILTVKDSDKLDAVEIGQRFTALGYEIYSTRSTCRVLNENGVPAKPINKVEEPSPNLLDLILSHEIDLVIDTPSQGVEHSKDGFIIRRNAIETGVTVLTSLDTAHALLTSLESSDRHNLSLVDISEI